MGSKGLCSRETELDVASVISSIWFRGVLVLVFELPCGIPIIMFCMAERPGLAGV